MMGLLLKIAKKNAVDHPSVHFEHCVNRSQRRFECRKCARICPNQVYSGVRGASPQWDRCQSCGLCVTACASRCIVPSPVNMKRHLMLAEKTGEITISCAHAQVQTGHIEECIAQLPWEFLAYLALGGRLVLNLKACKDCPHDACLELLEEQLYQLKCFLGGERYARHVVLCMDEEHVPQPEAISRREFFQGIAHGGKKTGSLAVADAAGAEMDGLIYRRMLARRVQALSRKGEFDCRMAIPWFSEKCYGCGICAQLCPNGAIEIREEKDGLRSIMITPYMCTVCGVCMETCREGGIEEICHAKLTSLERVTVAAVRSASCMRCGRAIAADMDERYCMVCSRKVKKR